ncbi:hypothetical protein [Herbaspirillum sp. ST 5-3]|uniref:hypothetical protein n=1 Tax=Oxalobacteraceae TaxID=75682 RepID=UPI0010A5324D|nr:hypothetical protein [Herbaspirillum sp. ST 5-3]
MSQVASTITLRRWGNPNESAFTEPVFVHESGSLPRDLSQATVVLRAEGLTRARAVLQADARQVLLGEAALLDDSLIATLSKEFGSPRIGLWIPVQRMARSWALDSYSNADFRCITPSSGAPAWEVLKSDGSATGTDAQWWIGQMLARGVTTALVAVDMQDDDDLNICAGMVECFGPALWLTPRTNAPAELEDWVRYGQARNIALRQLQRDDAVAMRALRQRLEASIEVLA